MFVKLEKGAPKIGEVEIFAEVVIVVDIFLLTKNLPELIRLILLILVKSIHGNSTLALTADQYQCLLLLLGELPYIFITTNLALVLGVVFSWDSPRFFFPTILPFPMPDSVVESILQSTTTHSPSSSSTSPVDDPPPPDPPRRSSRATRPPTYLGDYCCSHVQASLSSLSTSLVRSGTFFSLSSFNFLWSF
ncbi:hypothetical protein NE237_021972 [Protea cynaroides]|uniref:Uncharacterized protein n=1 Tax=Protea cynaroides TaxID=273540 RepID=A0A9Q0H8Z2_9MAGN|nr:hypothetical protein NE237_021972 [Protea cynaroides]